MAKPILQNDFDKRNDLLKEWYQSDMIIIKRLTYILTQVAKAFNFTFFDWYVYGAPIDCVGDVDSLFKFNKINASNIRFTRVERYPHTSWIIIKGKKIDLLQTIPRRWMFENFEKELIAARDLYIAQEEKKSNMILNARQTAMSKLSSKEIKVLGL